MLAPLVESLSCSCCSGKELHNISILLSCNAPNNSKQKDPYLTPLHSSSVRPTDQPDFVAHTGLARRLPVSLDEKVVVVLAATNNQAAEGNSGAGRQR